MRKGVSKAKVNFKLESNSYHRVIVPIYIPNLTEEYFKDGYEILELCLTSLLNSVHSKTRITLINNGCCEEIILYLEELYKSDNLIDQLYHNKYNIGKINAVNSAIKANREQLLTLTDADVMFLSGWQQAVEDVFKNFPKVGIVSPVPSTVAYKNEICSSTIGYGFFKNKLKFIKTLDSNALKMFETSIGRKLYSESHLDQMLVLKHKKNLASVGCGHFVITTKRKSLMSSPIEPSKNKIGGGDVTRYIDQPSNNKGFLRLGTLHNFAYHLGNVTEPWMFDTLKKDLDNTTNNSYNNSNDLHLTETGVNLIQKVSGIFILKIFRKYFKIKMLYFKKIGLTHNDY